MIKMNNLVFLHYLTKLFFPRVNVYRDNQDTTNKKEAKNIDKSGVDNPGIGIINKLDTSGANKSGISGKDKLSTSRAQKLGTGRADILGTGRVIKSKTSRTDK